MFKNKLIILAALIVASVAAFGALSCRRASDNGKIDGFWQIQEIYYKADGRTEYPTNKFIAVQLELLQLDGPGVLPQLTGVLSYDKNEDNFTVDFRNGPTEEQLNGFGFSGQQSVVHIDKADRSHLVLSTSIAVITCRKY